MTPETLLEAHQNPIQHSLTEHFPDEVLETSDHRGQAAVTVRPDRLLEIFGFLKENEQVDFLSDVTAVDCMNLDRKWDFEVVYQMLATGRDFLRFRLKVALEGRKEPKLSTATVHWRGANWPEREVAEMFGILFEGHPDPRKLLLPESFESHPLRKDYPVTGLGERDSFPVIERGFPEHEAKEDS